jgi:hypothetical protein
MFNGDFSISNSNNTGNPHENLLKYVDEIAEKIAKIDFEMALYDAKINSSISQLSHILSFTEKGTIKWRIDELPEVVISCLSEKEKFAVSKGINITKGFEGWRYTIEDAYLKAFNKLKDEIFSLQEKRIKLSNRRLKFFQEYSAPLSQSLKWYRSIEIPCDLDSNDILAMLLDNIIYDKDVEKTDQNRCFFEDDEIVDTLISVKLRIIDLIEKNALKEKNIGDEKLARITATEELFAEEISDDDFK